MYRRVSTIAAVLVTTLLTVPFGAAAQNKKALTLDDLVDDSLSPPAPSQLRWSPDGRLSYLLDAEKPEKSEDGEGKEDEDDAGRDLWVVDLASGQKEILVSAEELRSVAPSPGQAGVDERERTRRTRFGVAAYLWSPDGKQLLFTSSGQIWLFTLESRQAEVRAPSKKRVLDPKFSPDGQWISFVYEHDIWVVPAAGGKAKQLTTGGHELLLHGDLDWVYPEEFRVRTGYHWSPDSRHIAFLEMDESPVPIYPITEQLAWQASVDLQRYPKPGDPNPKVRVGIVGVETAGTAWLDRHAEYIPRIDWVDDENVAVQLLNRGQDELEMVFAKASSGRSRSILFERDAHWINITNDLNFLEDGRFLRTSDQSGLRHVYLYAADGKWARQLTDGEYNVGAIEGVDEDGGWVYYSSNEANVLGRDLYRIKLDGSGKERLTREKGTHRITMSPDAAAYIDSFSSLDITEVGRRTVHDLASGRTTELYRDRDLTEMYDLVQPEHLELKAPDDALVRVLLMKPPKMKRGKKHPVLVYAYGMAGFPVIRDSWSNSSRRSMFHQMLVQRGYVVAYVDDRSSSIPGHKYAALADHNVGPVAAEDHRVAVEYLRSLPYVDPERIGIWGWSGGGFTAAFHIARTGLFKVGIAGAPVTDWRLYDSIYTERYMGLPQDDPEAYDRTSAVKGAEGATGRLLLIHGTHDDNVHPQNTLQMMNALIKAGKQFDLMMYPNKTHGIRGKEHNLHMYTMIYEYLERHLRAEG